MIKTTPEHLQTLQLKTFSIVVANGSEETRYNRDLVYIQRRQTIKSTIVPFIFLIIRMRTDDDSTKI